MARFVVRLKRGGPWNWQLGMRSQDGWREHAAHMDRLLASGFLVLAGPLEGDREVLLIVEAESSEAIRARLAEDPWSVTGMLSPVAIEGWTILMGERRGDGA